VCTWSAFTAAAPPIGYYLAQAPSLGWNGSVTPSYGWGVVGATTRAGNGAATVRQERARAEPPAPRKRRALLTVLYDDQAKRCRRGTAPARAVEVRHVRRVVRRVGVLSLARCAALFYLCGLAIFLTAAVGLWQLASRSGAISGIESFIAQLFAIKTFRPRPSALLAGTVATGVASVIVMTIVTIVVGVVFNLISDVVGGIDVTVDEEVPAERSSNRRTSGYLELAPCRGDASLATRPLSTGDGAHGGREHLWRRSNGS
jgi:hypothetical protein